MLKNNEKMPHLSKDPITIKDDDISKEQKELMGYKIKDDTFIVTDIDVDESRSGITKNLMDKLKQNKEDAKEPEEEKKEADKPIEEKQEEATVSEDGEE